MSYRLACVTGASAGIGEATARGLAAKGIHLILLARRLDRLEELKKQLTSAYGIKIECFSLDISKREEVKKFLVNQSHLLFGVDVLVNNAGLAKGREAFQDGEPEHWDEMIDTNIKGLLYLTRGILPHMIKNNSGHIVNIGSVAGRWTYPNGAVYCATKFAVRAISEGLRQDLAGTSLRVTNIEPGMVETEFSLVRFGDEEKAKAVYKGMVPLQAQDVAETVLWCLERPGHVNVQELVLFPTDQSSIQNVHRR